jgi:hypothetical protein
MMKKKNKSDKRSRQTGWHQSSQNNQNANTKVRRASASAFLPGTNHDDCE